MPAFGRQNQRNSEIMITLTDTFNGYVISRHRSVAAAVRARRAHARMIERVNGRGAYIWTSITDEGRADIKEEIMSAESELAFGRGNGK